MTTIDHRPPLPARNTDWLVFDKIVAAGGSLHSTALTYQERVAVGRLIRCGVVHVPSVTARFAITPHVEAWRQGRKAKDDGKDATNPYDAVLATTTAEHLAWEPKRGAPGERLAALFKPQTNPFEAPLRQLQGRHRAWANGYAGRPHQP